jgi:hypothetical protein
MKEAWEFFERASLLEERESESFLAYRACLEGNLYLPESFWWFDALKSTFDLSSKCCWRTLMGRFGLIQQSLARFGDLMLWRVSLICLQSVVEELLWGVYAWSNKASFFVDFKRRWRRLENFLRELPCLKRGRASLLEELVLKEICIFQGPLFFRLRPSIYRDL